ncbi:MAG: glutamine-hydrolyzing carbamoyl-phosphate synthase small subunit [Nitrospirae bacterium]|nr:glutamine-hydrolyzing carbamoyl-phosphate synthase small subunit [Nitrospirota bacterium]
MPISKRPAMLVLADGTVFAGTAFGADGEAVGEVVFNTSLSGYQEIITDPSYRGQIVTMTAPQIGNCGVNPEDVESSRPWIEGLVVKECSPLPSNWRAKQSLDAYLKEWNVVGIEGLDTRALTKHIRDSGAQEGVISTVDLDAKRLAAKAKASPGLVGRDLVRDVTCDKPYSWTEEPWGTALESVKTRPQVIVYDFGVKRNILRCLVGVGCHVRVVPATTPASDVLELKPDGVVLSNGPGDPAAVKYAIDTVREFVGRVPLFGICLGQQLLGLALGGTTSKLKFGHHGGNQPVLDLATQQVTITSQNHGFAVDLDSFGSDVEATHVNLNDRTLEGLRHKKLPIFAVQYHPEASPGPHDAGYLFRRFVEMMNA